jgi:hypothetical protein
MIDFSKMPSKSKKIAEAISRKLGEKKEEKNVNLNEVVKTLAKRNVEANKEDE